MMEKAVIGVDLGGTNVRVGKVQDNQLIKHVSGPISSQDTEEVVIQEILNAIDWVMDEHVEGIGIGVPSVVDVEEGIVYSVENIPSWKKVHLKDRLEETYKMPVYVNNDANCFALGERYFGKARNHKNVVGLIIGTGMGAGVIVNDKLYSGTNCGAGEFGHIPYKEHDFEYYCSGPRFPRQYNIEGEILFERALNGEEEALEIFRQFGMDVGNAIKAILYSYDPEIIVFGGSVSKAYQFFELSIKEQLKTFNYQHALNRLKFERSEMEEIAIFGAAALYFDANNK